MIAVASSVCLSEREREEREREGVSNNYAYRNHCHNQTVFIIRTMCIPCARVQER